MERMTRRASMSFHLLVQDSMRRTRGAVAIGQTASGVFVLPYWSYLSEVLAARDH